VIVLPLVGVTWGSWAALTLYPGGLPLALLTPLILAATVPLVAWHRGWSLVGQRPESSPSIAGKEAELTTLGRLGDEKFVLLAEDASLEQTIKDGAAAKLDRTALV
jgi:hypothetical protein